MKTRVFMLVIMLALTAADSHAAGIFQKNKRRAKAKKAQPQQVVTTQKIPAKPIANPAPRPPLPPTPPPPPLPPHD